MNLENEWLNVIFLYNLILISNTVVVEENNSSFMPNGNRPVITSLNEQELMKMNWNETCK